MIDFARSFFGYNKDEVDQYFRDREKEIQSLLQSKYAKLEDIREFNQQQKAKLKEAVQKEQDLLQKREQIFNTFVKELARIEDDLQSKQDDVRRNKLNALNRLRHKVDELEKWSKSLDLFQTEITGLRDKYQTATLSSEQ